ncbi:hypothetical protein IAT40_005621 [Kwoniella sp. CBS 6097]
MKREYPSSSPSAAPTDVPRIPDAKPNFNVNMEGEDELDPSPQPASTPLPKATPKKSTQSPSKKAKTPTKSKSESKADVSNGTAAARVFGPPKKAKAEGAGVGKESWTMEKKRIIVEMLVDAGTKGVNLDMMSEQTGLTKQQLRDALKKRTDGGTNLRSQILASLNASTK